MFLFSFFSPDLNLMHVVFDNWLDKIGIAVSAQVPYFFNESFEYLFRFINYLGNIVTWVTSYTGLNYFTIVLIFDIIAGGIGLIIGSYVLKLIVKWWGAIIP